MDRSFLSHQDVVDASRDFICARPATYMDAGEAEDLELDIVYQDPDIAVVNKSVGVVVHPNTHDRSGTLVNALLHHLHDPQVLWSSLKAHVRPGAPVFIMDLLRPKSREDAQRMVDDGAAEEPDVLRRDFFLSLCAAFRTDEIEEQLAQAELGHLSVEIVSDLHLVVYGRL
jgi:SAM-dependent methyltransferase